MASNSLELPEDLRELCNALRRGGTSRFTQRRAVDAYGNHFDHPLDEIWCEGFEARTEAVAADFAEIESPEAAKETDDYYRANRAGYIPSPRRAEFSQILCFGEGGEGDPFCLDYRENPQRPTVICWDDAYWRRVAPDFASFLSLYELNANPWSVEEKDNWEAFEKARALTQEVLEKIENRRKQR